MLEELCRELNNWFDENPKDGSKRHYFSKFTIENGELDLSDIGIQNDQYFRIVGSVYNDGVYQYPANGLADEIFEGAIWAMSIPPQFIALASDIDDWQIKYCGVDSTAMSPFTSESFGGYSYSKSAGGGSYDGSGQVSWQGAFKSRLNQWRKIK